MKVIWKSAINVEGKRREPGEVFEPINKKSKEIQNLLNNKYLEKGD